MNVPVHESAPWKAGRVLPEDEFESVRTRAIFDCCKWDPQIEDTPVLAAFPLVLRRSAWDELAGLAEALAVETEAAESELLERPELFRRLGVPRRIRAAMDPTRGAPPARAAARVIRFDFHQTDQGLRISEANTDVPGGYNEASGFTTLMAGHYPGHQPAGDPVDALGAGLSDALGAGAVIGLVHASAYADDRQVMEYLGRRFLKYDLRPLQTAPDHIRWQGGRAAASAGGGTAALDGIFRFFPAEWLPALSRKSGWRHYFRGARTPICNPAAALLTQSKRFPLVWDQMTTPLATWRRFLPDTVDPRDVDPKQDAEWVFKPVFGRVGESIGIEGVVSPAEWNKIRRAARRHAGEWVAQKRFRAIPFECRGSSYYACIGVYTVNGRAAGAYGRLARRALIDQCSQECAVLIEPWFEGAEVQPAAAASTSFHEVK